MKFLILFLIMIPSLTFAAPPQEKYADLPGQIPVAEGKKLYQENGCPLCHGDQGKGDGSLAAGQTVTPRNFKEYEEMKRMPTIRMEQAIKNGIEGTAMPAFSQFSDSQVNALTNYLRSFLVESYVDLKMCAFQTYHVDAKILKQPFRVEADEPKKYNVEVSGTTISLSRKNKTLPATQKMHRTHFRVMQNDRMASVISVKIKRCKKEVDDMLKSIIPDKT